MASAVVGDARAHLADGPQPEDRHAASLGDAGVLDRLPGGGQDVGEVDETFVGQAFGFLGHLDRHVVRQGDTQELGLPAGYLPIELAEPEQRGPHALLAHLGSLAL